MAFWKARKRNRRVTPTHMVFMWFGFVVLAGTALLLLPWAHTGPEVRLGLVAALFTAVSAACVTGLSVVNVHDTFSLFGQAVIMLLMEIGGLGIMTFAAFGFRMLGRRLSLTQQAATADALYQNDAANEFKRTFMRILRLTVLLQLAGAVVLAVCLAAFGSQKGGGGHDPAFLLWSSLFHSVSAFCNSGFTLYRDGLAPVLDNIPYLVTLLVLVTLGGLGHLVLHELCRLPGYIRNHARKPHWVSLHTKVVLSMSASLITLGIVAIWLLGTGDEGSDLWQAIFESVSARTAGFSIVHQSLLPLPSIVLLIFMMFVGGSPGSCAGGIKTTSLAIWIARIRANLRNDPNVNLFGFTIAPELVSRARILMAVTMIWNVVGVFILAAAHPDENLQTLVFEQVSAFGTVGLSMDFTPRLNTVSRLWICVSMFVGRLGPLSIALLVLPSSRASVTRPIGRVMVG